MLPLAAVAGFAATPALAQKKGGTLTVGVELDIAGFDPLKVGVYDTSANIAASLFLEQLTRLGDDGKPKPSLALSWSASDDFKTWTFKLRPDVKFSDGTPFNAQAVAWNFARQKDPKNNCRCAFYIANIAQRRSQGRPHGRLHAQGSGGELPRAADAARPEQHHPFADGDPGQGRRLQPQSGRHRAVRREVVDGGRPHGGGAQPQLLGQGQAQPRPRRAAAAARFAVALRQPGVGRDRRGVGRRVRGRQHRPRAQERTRCRCSSYVGSGAGGRRHQHQGAAARRRARAPGAGHGARPQEDVAGAHQRPRPAGDQSLRRGLVGQVQGRRRAARAIPRRPPS